MKFSTKQGLLLFFLCVSLVSNAQIYRAKAGLNLSSMFVRNYSGRLTNNVKIHPGIHLGGTAEFPIRDHISFETGFLFSTKGFTSEISTVKGTLNTYYIDIPLTGRITHEWKGQAFYGTFGPYLGVGLAGKHKRVGPGDGKIYWGNSQNDDLKRLETRLIFGAGIIFAPIEVGLQYTIGLSNLSPYTAEGSKIANRVFAITAAYKIKNN